MKYPYSDGDKISEPNTYFYTEYIGLDFFDYFDESRNNILSLDNKSIKPVISNKRSNSLKANTLNTIDYLNELFSLLIDKRGVDTYKKVDFLLKKFEISKKIYNVYDLEWRPTNQSNAFSFKLYIGFALILDTSYKNTRKLNYLNALLKIIDSLVSVYEDLDILEKRNLTWLILEETKHINELKNKLVVSQ
jgi:hypothetical protein